MACGLNGIPQMLLQSVVPRRAIVWRSNQACAGPDVNSVHKTFAILQEHLEISESRESSRPHLSAGFASAYEDAPSSALDFEYTTYAIKRISSKEKHEQKRRQARLTTRKRYPLKEGKGYYVFETSSGDTSMLDVAEDDGRPASLLEQAARRHAGAIASLNMGMETASQLHSELKHVETDMHDMELHQRVVWQQQQHFQHEQQQQHAHELLQNNQFRQKHKQQQHQGLDVRQQQSHRNMQQQRQPVQFGLPQQLPQQQQQHDEESQWVHRSSGAHHNPQQVGKNSCHSTVNGTLTMHVLDSCVAVPQEGSTRDSHQCQQSPQPLQTPTLVSTDDQHPWSKLPSTSSLHQPQRQQQQQQQLRQQQSSKQSPTTPQHQTELPSTSLDPEQQQPPSNTSSSTCSLVKAARKTAQRRLAVGSHALSLRTYQAAANPMLRAALESIEPTDVRHRVKNLRSCLGLSYRQAVCLVYAEPKLLALDELQVALQVQQLLAFVTFCPPPKMKQPTTHAGIQGVAQASQLGDHSRGAARSNRKSERDPGHTDTAAEGQPVVVNPEGPLALEPLLLPEVARLVEQVPQLLTSPADYCQVVEALLVLLAGDLPAVTRMLHRRPVLMTQGHRQTLRGRDLQSLGGAGSIDTTNQTSDTSSSSSSSGSGSQRSSHVDSDSRSSSFDAAADGHLAYLHVYETVLGILQEELQVDKRSALSLVQREPGLLAVVPAALRDAVHAISKPFQLDVRVLREVVEHSPELLCMSPGLLKPYCRRFQALMVASEAWSPFLPRLLAHPRNLAVALSFDTSRYDRLDYLVKTRRDRCMGYKQALTMSNEDFLDMYPGYQQWWSRRGR